MAFDKDKPASSTSLRNSNPEILANQAAIETALNREHTFSTGGAAGAQAQHKQGSARCFFQDAAPTTQVDGGAFAATDLGSLWVDTNSSPDNQFNILTATTPTWTPISTEIIAVLLASNRVFAGTLGVDGALTASGTLDVVGNLDPTTLETTNGGFLDEDDMASDAADKVASQQSIKAHDAFGARTTEDDETNTMLVAHAYLANQDGFVVVVHTSAGTADIVTGYVDTDDNPASGGTVLGAINARTPGAVDSVMFPVRNGEFWEVTISAGASAIYWQPKSGALVKCTDQD